MTVKQLSAIDLNTRLHHEDNLLLLDVREPHEYDYAHIANSVLIPLQQVPQRINELDPQQAIVVICHHGMRSLQAANYLVHAGFQDVSNLVGGIDAWSCSCDHSVRRY
jgi:rhodanese-related sulfurtransferase